MQSSKDRNHYPNPNPNQDDERRRRLQHLCLDKGYKSTEEEQELIKRGYILAHTNQEEEKEERRR